MRVLLDGLVKLTAMSPGARETMLEIRARGDLLGEREVLYGTGIPVGNGTARPAQAIRCPAPRAARRHGHRAAADPRTCHSRRQVRPVHGIRTRRYDGHGPRSGARLSETQLRLGGIASENANRRLARALLLLSMSTALPGVERTWLQLSQAELASWIGVSRETVERSCATGAGAASSRAATAGSSSSGR